MADVPVRQSLAATVVYLLRIQTRPILRLHQTTRKRPLVRNSGGCARKGKHGSKPSADIPRSQKNSHRTFNTAVVYRADAGKNVRIPTRKPAPAHGRPFELSSNVHNRSAHFGRNLWRDHLGEARWRRTKSRSAAACRGALGGNMAKVEKFDPQEQIRLAC